MAIDLALLKVELTTGSFANTLYSANVSARDYNALTETINTRGVTGSSITVGVIFAQDLQQAVVVSEYVLLTATQRDLWGTLTTTAINGISISNPLIRSQVLGIWSVGLSGTRGNLGALQTRAASRAELLFGEGVRVDTNSIYVALTQ